MKKILLLLFVWVMMCGGCNYESKMINAIGIAKFKNKDFKGAIVELDKAISINPQNTLAYYYRGLAKSNLNKNE